MENKKMWVGLVKQMIYEIVILFLLYLFIGNNFGNNIFSDNWFEKITDPAFLNSFSSLPPIFEIIIIIISAIIAVPLLFIIIPCVNVFFALSMFWMPIFITFLLCLTGVQESCAKSFGGQYPNVALSKIQVWYKKSKKIYFPFIIASRVVFISLLFLKAFNAPLDYIANFLLFKWEMSGNLISILILSVGAVITVFSMLFSILRYRAPENLNEYTCPNCHRVAWIKKWYKVKIQDAKYNTWETSSGYYSRGTVGEVVDSAGNHIGDVEGDVWVDTSRIRSRKIQQAVYECHVIYEPCGCDVKKGTIKE